MQKITRVEVCGEPYQSSDLELRFCGRHKAHDGHHFVDPFPFDPKPGAPDIATCVECALTDDVAGFTLCSECAQPVHANGLCTASCPFCGDLICQSCIDSASAGGWHACGSKDPDDVSARRPAWA